MRPSATSVCDLDLLDVHMTEDDSSVVCIYILECILIPDRVTPVKVESLQIFRSHLYATSV